MRVGIIVSKGFSSQNVGVCVGWALCWRCVARSGLVVLRSRFKTRLRLPFGSANGLVLDLVSSPLALGSHAACY